MQANELLSAPAAARRTLLDRVLRSNRPVQIKSLRSWVDETREEMRRSQNKAVDRIARGKGNSIADTDGPYALVLEQLRTLDEPATVAEIEALAALVEHAQRILLSVRPRELAAAS